MYFHGGMDKVRLDKRTDALASCDTGKTMSQAYTKPYDGGVRVSVFCERKRQHYEKHWRLSYGVEGG
jgi:hypothetical protein